MDYAVYFNGVWESVLDEIIIAQGENPGVICYLQPAQPKYYSNLKSNPPSITSPVKAYFSTTTDLSTVAYKGLIVGWEDKQKLSGQRLAEFNNHIEKYQPGEIDRLVENGEAVNLLSIKDLVKLETTFHVNNLIKISDNKPHKVKTRTGGHSYVKELPADFVAEQSNVFVPIDFGQGKKYLRKDIIDTYGGQSRSGITTPSNHPIIFLFTSKVGEQFGYDDGWTDDGTFEICGEGQVGDMEFVRGNKAVLEHLENGKELHLFEAVGGGYVRYISEMFYKSHREDIGPDKNGADRKRILFELTPFEIKTESPEQKQERNKASITGDKAEGIFEDNALDDFGWKVINKTDKQNLGYDFLCEDPELFIEVKGCLDGVGSIRLTEREWEVAKEKKDQYVLVIVSRVDDKYEFAEMVKFEDPYSRFNSVIKEQIVKVKSLHINGRDLRELVE
jgi:hypothetical protein